MAHPFTRFPELPRELRDKIWEFAAFDTPNPVIQVRFCPQTRVLSDSNDVDRQLMRVSRTRSVCVEARQAVERVAKQTRPTYWLKLCPVNNRSSWHIAQEEETPVLEKAVCEVDPPALKRTSGTVVLDTTAWPLPYTLKDHANAITCSRTLDGLDVKAIFVVGYKENMCQHSGLGQAFLAMLDPQGAASMVEAIEKAAFFNLIPILRSAPLEDHLYRPPPLLRLPQPDLLGMKRRLAESLEQHLPEGVRKGPGVGPLQGSSSWRVLCSWDREDSLDVHFGLPQQMWLQLIQLRQTQMQKPLLAGLSAEFPNLERISVLIPQSDNPIFISGVGECERSRHIKIRHWTTTAFKED